MVGGVHGGRVHGRGMFVAGGIHGSGECGRRACVAVGGMCGMHDPLADTTRYGQ